MAPSAHFRRAHSRGKNCGENTEIRVVYYSPLGTAPGLGPPRARTVRGLQLIDLCREKCDYEIPACRSTGGGQIEQGRSGKEQPIPAISSVLFFARLFARSLACQRSFHALLFAGLQVEGVTFHFLYDVFLLHLALEAA